MTVTEDGYIQCEECEGSGKDPKTGMYCRGCNSQGKIPPKRQDVVKLLSKIITMIERQGEHSGND